MEAQANEASKTSGSDSAARDDSPRGERGATEGTAPLLSLSLGDEENDEGGSVSRRKALPVAPGVGRSGGGGGGGD
jgi:hypothetical protein